MPYYKHPLDVTALSSWQALERHREAMQAFSMRDAFAAAPERFKRFSLSGCGLLLDYSKNLITNETRDLLVRLAREIGLERAIRALFDNPAIAYIDAHNAAHGCFAARIERNAA